MDITTLLENRAEAVSLAQRCNQIAVYDLAQQAEISTGGTGEEVYGLPPLVERLPALKHRLQRKSNG